MSKRVSEGDAQIPGKKHRLETTGLLFPTLRFLICNADSECVAMSLLLAFPQFFGLYRENRCRTKADREFLLKIRNKPQKLLNPRYFTKQYYREAFEQDSLVRVKLCFEIRGLDYFLKKINPYRIALITIEFGCHICWRWFLSVTQDLKLCKKAIKGWPFDYVSIANLTNVPFMLSTCPGLATYDFFLRICGILNDRSNSLQKVKGWLYISPIIQNFKEFCPVDWSFLLLQELKRLSCARFEQFLQEDGESLRQILLTFRLEACDLPTLLHVGLLRCRLNLPYPITTTLDPSQQEREHEMYNFIQGKQFEHPVPDQVETLWTFILNLEHRCLQFIHLLHYNDRLPFLFLYVARSLHGDFLKRKTIGEKVYLECENLIKQYSSHDVLNAFLITCVKTVYYNRLFHFFALDVEALFERSNFNLWLTNIVVLRRILATLDNRLAQKIVIDMIENTNLMEMEMHRPEHEDDERLMLLKDVLIEPPGFRQYFFNKPTPLTHNLVIWKRSED